VTGSIEHESESLRETAVREVREETGIDATLYGLANWQLQNRFEIFKKRRSRFAPGITHNLEHVFGLTVPGRLDITLAPAEHTGFQWLPWREAAAKCLSWSNRDAILLLPEKRAADI
jgi:dATP pyrophosphohydrolase